jgi:diguanylate cyclase (GGDEF)-like protein
MHSLYDVLLAQHTRQLTPVSCAYSTVQQLHRYFEDVVLENNLSALLIESLAFSPKRPAREKSRIRDLARGDRSTFYFAHPADALNGIVSHIAATSTAAPVILPQAETNHVDEHFIVIADARFSALLATVRGRVNDTRAGGDEVFWTFEPDIVYSALEYLMARVSAEHPSQAAVFGAAVRTSMPKATSLQLTVSVTTKLAHLLQEQAGREIAINRIATAIRESLELGDILQKTADEVGSALNVTSCALRVEGARADESPAYVYSKAGDQSPVELEKLRNELDRHTDYLHNYQELIVHDSDNEAEDAIEQPPFVVVPLIFNGRLMGVLQVNSNDHGRVWQESEILLLRTVADQVAVAVNHAGLFAQIQQQALTDALTGLFNRRSFEINLEKEVMMSRRTHQPLSLIMLDLDRFKHLNDTAGHDAGDDALRRLADCFRTELRAVDSAARFGGDEFALILPQAYADGALIVAERLRARIEQIDIPDVGNLTASIGIATFPLNANSRAELFRAADDALYMAKRTGRNRVCVAENLAKKFSDSGANVMRKTEPQQTSEDVVM